MYRSWIRIDAFCASHAVLSIIQAISRKSESRHTATLAVAAIEFGVRESHGYILLLGQCHLRNNGASSRNGIGPVTRAGRVR
jgi:hypothetical protein